MKDTSYDKETTRQNLIAELARKKGANKAVQSSSNSSQSSSRGTAAQKRERKQKDKNDKKVAKA